MFEKFHAPRQPIALRPLHRAFRDGNGQLWIRARGVADDCCVCGQFIYKPMESYQAQTRLHQVAHVYCCEVQHGGPSNVA